MTDFMTGTTDEPGPMLTIGDLAEQTGLSPATLRIWEQRHGFPVPQRRASGHRRYPETEVAAVRNVVAQRDAGVRLDVAISRAIEQAKRAARPGSPSIYADLRRRHPTLPTYRMHKSTLIAMSWAIEDELCATAQQAHVFGAFQRPENYAPSRPRWRELARISRSAFVFASFDEGALGDPDLADDEHEPILVPLAVQAPMRQEWAVVVDGDRLPAVLTAWELPGQYDVPDRDRLFECAWTVEPAVVRDASRLCLQVALDAGVAVSEEVVTDLEAPTLATSPDPRATMNLFNRVIAYSDAIARR